MKDKNIVTVYDREETIYDIVDSIRVIQNEGYRIEDIRVHGNNEALIIEYTK